jgi:general secretion pathway protein G
MNNAHHEDRRQKGFPCSEFWLWASPLFRSKTGTKPKSTTGFTLIEVLVVVAIIGLLASVILVSLKSAEEKARISRAQVEVQELQKALEQYHLDHGTWPAGFFSNDITDLSQWNSSWSDGYISTVGLDPWNTPYYLDGMPDTECGIGQTGICSAGPNKVFQSFNNPNARAVGDDICVYFAPEC